jgi:hypothetical protein
MTEQVWNSIRANARVAALASEWSKALFGKTYREIENFPSLTNTAANDEIFMPISEVRDITPSYLGFLREQINLEPRGKEWAAVLKARLAALEPYVGKVLGNLSARRMRSGYIEGCWVIFDPESFEVIYVENT